MYIGCHLSSAKGFLQMGKDALFAGANVFQFFTRNPRGSKSKEIVPEDAEALRQLLKTYKFGPILAHAPYTLNPCSPSESTREFAWQTMEDDLERMEYFPGNLYVFHPGSHVGQGKETGIRQITEMLNEILRPEQNTTVLLETMAGKGSEIGGRFEELKAILDGVQLSDKMGICLDICHVHDGGYDVVNDLDGVLQQFNRQIGLEKIRAVHVADSKNPLASHKDRHAPLGEGEMGMEAFMRVFRHPALRHLPFYLETPCDLAGHKAEIERVKTRLAGDLS